MDGDKTRRLVAMDMDQTRRLVTMDVDKTRKQPRLVLTSLHVPLDIVEEILCRLSVKHLIQLCCVCKSWNSLISGDSEFAKKHLRSRYIQHLILSPNHSSTAFTLSHSPISSIFRSTPTTRVKRLKYSIREILTQREYRNRASTCDGMVCVKIDECSAFVCNPSIRKFKILPPFIIPYHTQSFVQIFYTLVHDRFTNTYKVFAVDTACCKIQVSVHTLGTDYWRKIQDFPDPPNLVPVLRPGIFVNDSVNWLVNDPPLIVSLDLEKESYQKLSWPVFDDIYFFATLGRLRGCLTLLFHRYDDQFSDIWIMKQHGNQNSWTKLLTVPPVGQCQFHCYTKALYISKDGRVLMEFLKKWKYSLVVYDSINNTFNTPKFRSSIHGDEMGATEVYVESLISPL